MKNTDNRNNTGSIPKALRNAFIIHFWADVLFAIPLMLAPEALLGFFGWDQIDPFTARIVAAALLGIGTESLLGRDGNRDSYLTMLRMKIIWSSAAVIGIAWSIAEVGWQVPIMAWGILGIFIIFNALWVYWFRRLREKGSYMFEEKK